MLVLADTACLAHETIELLGSKLISALESPQRLKTIIEAIEASESHDLKLKHTTPEQVNAASDLFEKSSELISSTQSGMESDARDHARSCMALLLATHDRDYLRHLMSAHKKWVENKLIEDHESILPECSRVPSRVAGRKGPPKDVFAQTGYYAFDMSTGICKDTWYSAWASVLLAYEAAMEVRADTGSRKDVLALCRPPGHHCTTEMAGGYCYINNAVVAVRALQGYSAEGGRQSSTSDLRKVAILDLDFHHGNGTQDAFYSDNSVLYVSIHGQDEYPYYTGSTDETGLGPGQGYNLNLPLLAGSSIQQYMTQLDLAIARIQDFKPEYLVVSLGFDTFETDPLGCFKIATEDYAEIAGRVRMSAGLSDVPAVILLEGGYVVEKLGANMLSFLKGWES